MSQEKHTVEQVRLWASAYRDEGGHGLIVQMLESYAELLTKASIELELTPEWCHWMAEQMQRKADKDAARGAIVPVSYYVSNALGFARALLAASPANPAPAALTDAPYRKLLAALVDIHDDAWDHAPEHRTYVECAFNETIDEARALLAASPANQVEDATAAARDVLAERQRQIDKFGWTAEHDDGHGNGSLAAAAACYALYSKEYFPIGHPPGTWPWMPGWWKPKNRRFNLVRAAALLLAEIERIDRAAMSATPPAVEGK